MPLTAELHVTMADHATENFPNTLQLRWFQGILSKDLHFNQSARLQNADDSSSLTLKAPSFHSKHKSSEYACILMEVQGFSRLSCLYRNVHPDL